MLDETHTHTQTVTQTHMDMEIYIHESCLLNGNQIVKIIINRRIMQIFNEVVRKC